MVMQIQEEWENLQLHYNVICKGERCEEVLELRKGWNWDYKGTGDLKGVTKSVPSSPLLFFTCYKKLLTVQKFYFSVWPAFIPFQLFKFYPLTTDNTLLKSIFVNFCRKPAGRQEVLKLKVILSEFLWEIFYLINSR